MKQYKNLGARTDIIGYELGNQTITIHYTDGWCFLFSEKSAGMETLQIMIRLAENGQGLSEFIQRSAARLYAGKWRYFK